MVVNAYRRELDANGLSGQSVAEEALQQVIRDSRTVLRKAAGQPDHVGSRCLAAAVFDQCAWLRSTYPTHDLQDAKLTRLMIALVEILFMNVNFRRFFKKVLRPQAVKDGVRAFSKGVRPMEAQGLPQMTPQNGEKRKKCRNKNNDKNHACSNAYFYVVFGVFCVFLFVFVFVLR